MNELSRLERHIDEGSIKLINVVGIPRSISTALGRSLNETPEHSIFVNEPFNRRTRDIGAAVGALLGAAEPVLEAEGSPLAVITKNMAAYLSPDTYRQMSEIASGEVFTVRDPLVQMASLATRIANDIAVETGANKVTQETVYPYLGEVAAFLEDSELSQDFSRTSWQAIGDHYDNVVDPGHVAVVDGGQLTANPAETLQATCAQIGLEYADSMVAGWANDYTNVNVGSSRFGTTENAWTSHAATSSGIIQIQREPLDLDRIPEAMRDHIVNVALPIYTRMVSPT